MALIGSCKTLLLSLEMRGELLSRRLWIIEDEEQLLKKK
jgi:hypothetical protein